MDYTGARRSGRKDAEEAFFKEVALWIIGKVQPPVRYHPLTHEETEPQRSDVIKNWRAAGYALACHLVPKRKGKRFPLELESFIEGLRQRKDEYEHELSSAASGGKGAAAARVEVFDVEACERAEERAEKYLRLATHENTEVEEARNAALALAKMIGKSELALLAWERVRHFARHLRQMEDLFELMRRESPYHFFYGAPEQLGRRFITIVDEEGIGR